MVVAHGVKLHSLRGALLEPRGSWQCLDLLVNYNIHFSDVHGFIHSRGAAFPLEIHIDELPLQAVERDRFPLSQVMWAAFRITENNRIT